MEPWNPSTIVTRFSIHNNLGAVLVTAVEPMTILWDRDVPYNGFQLSYVRGLLIPCMRSSVWNRYLEKVRSHRKIDIWGFKRIQQLESIKSTPKYQLSIPISIWIVVRMSQRGCLCNWYKYLTRKPCSGNHSNQQNPISNMRYFTIIATAVAAFSPMVAADWGWPEDPFVTGTCAATCNGFAVAFTRDKVKDYCNELVKDGYIHHLTLFSQSLTYWQLPRRACYSKPRLRHLCSKRRHRL